MNKKEISAILSRASREEVEKIAAPLKEEHKIEIIKEPQKTLVMVKVRESIGQSLFYLGEVLATECMVLVNGTKGFSVMAGDDFEKTLDAAVIDGFLNSQRNVRTTHTVERRTAGTVDEDAVTGQIQELGRRQEAGRGRRNAQIMKSKVNFNVMGEA